MYVVRGGRGFGRTFRPRLFRSVPGRDFAKSVWWISISMRVYRPRLKPEAKASRGVLLTDVAALPSIPPRLRVGEFTGPDNECRYAFRKGGYHSSHVKSSGPAHGVSGIQGRDKVTGRGRKTGRIEDRRRGSPGLLLYLMLISPRHRASRYHCGSATGGGPREEVLVPAPPQRLRPIT